MNNDLHFSSKSNEWETPKWLFDLLNKEFNFQLDAAATQDNALCQNFYTAEQNSLIQDWSKYKSIFLNPPYGRLIGKFIKKAFEESQKDCVVVLLIPARTDVKAFHEYCSKGEIRFIKSRLKFVDKSKDKNFKISPAPFPSAIVIFKKENSPQVKFIELKQPQ